MYKMVLYPVHRLIFKIVFKKMGRVMLRPDLLFPSPYTIQSRASKGQTGRMMPDVGRGCFGLKFSSGQRSNGDAGGGCYPKIIVGATETRASRLYSIGC